MNNKLSLDPKVFSLEAVMATAYWCADKMVADITTSDEGINVVLKGVAGRCVDEHDIDEFKTMLVHNQIRQRLSVEFAPIEKAIIEKAFSPVTVRG